VLLPNADHAAGLARAEHVRSVVAAETLQHQGRRVPVTISLGVAELGSGEMSADVYRRADQRLYASKHAGRNRVS
jgi:diguanylate cyclase (GGDEF)-like protein